MYEVKYTNDFQHKNKLFPMNIKTDKNYEVKEEITDGICRIIEDSEPCESEVHDRGICQRHRMALERRGLLDDLAASNSTENVLFSSDSGLSCLAGTGAVAVDGVGGRVAEVDCESNKCC